MNDSKNLRNFKALVDNAFKNAPLYLRQDKAAKILSEANEDLSGKEFQELIDYVFERLEK